MRRGEAIVRGPHEAAEAYRDHDVLTADPLSLVARAYEAALRHLARARTALAAGDLAAKGAAVARASDCLGLLRGALDMERGGEIARNLDRLYEYFSRRLLEGHALNRDEAFAEVFGHLRELGETWRRAAASTRSVEPAPGRPAR